MFDGGYTYCSTVDIHHPSVCPCNSLERPRMVDGQRLDKARLIGIDPQSRNIRSLHRRSKGRQLMDYR